MRFLLILVALATLTACTDARSTTTPPRAVEPMPLIGEFRAESDTARISTGNVSIERGGLLFDKGVVLFTRTLEPRRGENLIARDGDSYAAVAVGPAELTIELRRVTQQSLSGGAVGLCNGAPPTYVALAYQERATAITLLVFSGDEPPGPAATQSRVCATYGYVAPNGARTRQGVVLQ